MMLATVVESGLTPDELLLQEALRDGWAVRRDVPMQTIGDPDRALQARVVGLDVTHVGRLRESLREFGSLRPVVVFRDEASRRVWLADGFHRHEAYRLEGREMIPSFLAEGGYRGALKFSTMCNRTNCLLRTKDDERKAAWMLFGDTEWRKRSHAEIAKHIGVNKQTVMKWRALYAEEKGEPLPDEVIDRSGRARPRTVNLGRGSIGAQQDDGRYTKTINGKKHFLGYNEQQARSKLKELTKGTGHSTKIHPETIRNMLATAGIGCAGACNSHTSSLGECFLAKDAAIVYGEADRGMVFQALIGRAILNREKHKPGGRVLVVCRNPPLCDAFEIAKRLGVEFLAPDDLVESLKAT